MAATRPTVVPGEAPAPAPAAVESPSPGESLTLSPAQVAEILETNRMLRAALVAKSASPEGPVPAMPLPTQDEARAMARKSGKFVLSRDGYVGPPVIQPVPAAALR
jgi:hypothetical protein